MKLKSKGYEWGEIEGEQVLVSQDFPFLCFHDLAHEPGSGWYTVTHVPSGKAIANVETRAYALDLIPRLAGLAGLEQIEPGATTLAETLDLINQWRKQLVPRPPKTKPVLEVKQVRLTPVYRPGRTPDKYVVSADRMYASVLGRMMAGDETVTPEMYREASEQSRVLSWKENIMARVDNVLLAHDLDDLSAPAPRPRRDRLLDGTPCTWAGFVASFHKLNEMGDRIADVAEQMVEVCEQCSVVGWDEGDRLEFSQLERQFIGLVCEGWLEWSAAVSHLLCSTPEQQATVVAKLGFVGAAGRGWHELGKKTFLRHEYILIDLRRWRIARLKA